MGIIADKLDALDEERSDKLKGALSWLKNMDTADKTGVVTNDEAETKAWPPTTSKTGEKQEYEHSLKIIDKHTVLIGAAGDNGYKQPDIQLRQLNDIYVNETRKAFAKCATTDPIAAPALKVRHNSLFEDGIELKLVPKSTVNPQTGSRLTESEITALVTAESAEYGMYLAQIEDWAKKINIVKIMRQCDSSAFTQGRTAALITPGVQDLATGMLPESIKLLTYDTIREVIIDVGRTYKMQGLTLQRLEKTHARMDEVVYILKGDLGLRPTDDYYGTSSFEPMLVISQTIKRLYNYNMPEAVVAAYIDRALLMFDFKESNIANEEEHMTKVVQQVATRGNTAIATGEELRDVKSVGVKTDSAMIDIIERKLADAMLSIVGVPKSMLNREHTLNRDIATVQIIQYLKLIRKPAEVAICTDFSEHLLTPLLAHLKGKNVNELSMRLEIHTKTAIPTDPLIEEKSDEITSQHVEQTQSTMFGAAGRALTLSDQNMQKLESMIGSELKPLLVKYAKSTATIDDLRDRNGPLIYNKLVQGAQAAYMEGQQYAQEQLKTKLPPILTNTDINKIQDTARQTEEAFWSGVTKLRDGVKKEMDTRAGKDSKKLIGAFGWDQVFAFQLANNYAYGLQTMIGTTAVNLGTISASNQITGTPDAKQEVREIWTTWKDDKVCPLCRPLEGSEINEDLGDKPPPRHPRCRCRLVPHV